ncbi:hypothetical protein ACFP3I_22515 [Chryseobacterium arachidis]
MNSSLLKLKQIAILSGILKGGRLCCYYYSRCVAAAFNDFIVMKTSC